MVRKSLVLLLAFTLLFQAASAQGQVGVEIASSTAEAGEAQAIDFIASVQGIEEFGIEFEWDFNDGVKATTRENKTSYAYRLGGNYTVGVKVREKEKVLAEDSVKIEINESEFKPRLLLPLSRPGLAYAEEKRSTHEVKLDFLDSLGLPIEPGIEIIIHSATIKGREIGLERGEEGIFNGSFDSDHSFFNIEKLELDVEISGERKNFSLPIFFKKDLRAETPFTEGMKFNLKDKIDRIAFDLVLGQEKVLRGDFKAAVRSGRRAAERALFFEGGKWNAEFDYTISRRDFTEGIRLHVYGKDEFGNVLEESFDVPLIQPSKEFEVRLVEPFSGDTGQLCFGQEAEFVAQISPKENLEFLENVRIRIESGDGLIRGELSREGDYFRAKLRVPESGASELKLRLLAEAEMLGEKKFSEKQITVVLVEMEASQPDLGLVFAALFAIALLGFSGYIFISRKKGKKEEKIVSKARLREINGMLKRARVGYYRRKLTESEYRERVLKLQQEKELIKKKIEKGKKG